MNAGNEGRRGAAKGDFCCSSWLMRAATCSDFQRKGEEGPWHKGGKYSRRTAGFRGNCKSLRIPPPILIVYGTGVVELNGDVHFYREIYGGDAVLESELAKSYPYPR